MCDNKRRRGMDSPSMGVVMKYILIVMFAFSLVSCATDRSPSSVNPETIEDGMNADYYSAPNLR